MKRTGHRIGRRRIAGARRAALAQAQTVIKFSHVVAPDTPKGKGSLKFKELAEKYTNGKVKVEVYPNSQLYKDNEELQALQLGAVQMLAPSLAKFGPLGVKEFEGSTCRTSCRTRRRFVRSPMGAGQEADGHARAQGHHRPGLLGQRLQGHERQQEARSDQADFRGLKMRIQSSKVLEAQMRALGAIPK